MPLLGDMPHTEGHFVRWMIHSVFRLKDRIRT